MTHPLAPLAAFRQFLPVRLVPLANGKSDKLPLTPTGELTPKDQGGAHNPAYWMTWAEAHARAVAWGPNHGVGFVLTAADPFWCLDIDGALTPTGWSQLAQDLIAQLPGTAVEVSSSGTGLHIWGQGPVPEHRCKNTQLHIELYHADRFILLGSNPVGSMAQACPHIAAVAARYFPPRLELDQGLAEGPISTWRGPTDDEELLRRMLNSKGSIKAAFGATATFADLWEGNDATLERVFPKPEGGYDGSSVDAALANHLAFWTGCDKARMERLMRRSALVRDKWDREDYMLATIGLACQRDPSQVLQDPAPKVGAMTTLALPEEGGLLTGQVTANLDPFVPAEKQVEMFAGCVYVEDEHKILMPDGSMRRREQFRAKFGGVKFLLGIDNKKTTACAFEAFTENTATAMPKVSGTCYKPQLPYQALLKDSAGRVLVNTYRKPVVDLTPGNIDRFHRHMTLMMPDERDRLIVYSFMAAVLQYPGIKFGWALLVQGCEGGGKTFLNEVLKHGVGIQHYHMVGAKHLDSQFNGWMASKVLYIIEDLFAGDRADVMEVMKPWITNTHVEVESKGVEKRTVEVCGNFLAGSNHKNAVIKRKGDRRWCVIFTAQQDRDRMAAEQGMDARYFKELYDWGRDGGGYGAVCEWLLRWQIPEEFDPSKHAKVAPRTSSTDEAIAASRSPLAQSIVEAIEAEVIGFRGGWIGAEELEQLLERSRAKVAHQKRTEILGELDYMPHPGLPEGRSCQAVLPYGKRVRIFVKRGSPASMQQGPAAIVQAYLAAQGLGNAAS